MVNKLRIEFIDLAKGFCIFILVYHHIMTGGHGSFMLSFLLIIPVMCRFYPHITGQKDLFVTKK